MILFVFAALLFRSCQKKLCLSQHSRVCQNLWDPGLVTNSDLVLGQILAELQIIDFFAWALHRWVEDSVVGVSWTFRFCWIPSVFTAASNSKVLVIATNKEFLSRKTFQFQEWFLSSQRSCWATSAPCFLSLHFGDYPKNNKWHYFFTFCCIFLWEEILK